MDAHPNFSRPSPNRQSKEILYQQVSNLYSPMTEMDSTMISKPPVVYCARCNGPFAAFEDMACTGRDEYWHLSCFVCAQCFKPFGEDMEYYDFGGRKYCEQDFQTLFAPCCSRCNHYIIGRYIRALNKCWHPNCFLCDKCSCPLADQGFIKRNNQALCRSCNILENAVIRKSHICRKCKAPIDCDQDGQPLRYKDETYHSYHFNCHSCGIELKPDARQVNGDLFCLKCHDKMDIPICGACRRPIEERVVTALGKHWHKEHFACAQCEKPFLGKRHFEMKGSAYCEQDYYELFGHTCCVCSKVVCGDILFALDKYYCPDHFFCHHCHSRLIANKSKFFDFDSKPCCKKCYRKLPASLRRQLSQKKKELQSKN